MSESKIIVTGGSGFVGQNLTNYLQQNSKFAIRSLSREELQQYVANIPGDVNTLVHLAGKAHDIKNTSSPYEFYQVNYEITKRLYNSFLQSGATKFIYVSSVKAVADKIDGVLYETSPAHPETHYGKSKLMAEQYILNEPLPPGKSFYILRPCMIHGPNNKGNLNLLYLFVKKNLPFPLAAFNNERSFLSIQNLCFIINELIDRDDIPGGTYNVADDEPISTNQIIKIMAQSLGKTPKLWKVSPEIIKILAAIGDSLNLPLTTERLEKLTENFVISNSKIKTAIGKKLPVTTMEGLLLTAQSFKA